jgi:hypothetical protein
MADLPHAMTAAKKKARVIHAGTPAGGSKI